ncbi:MAG: hypothetical protein ABIO70_13900 [Pseudomonadota bacterium]
MSPRALGTIALALLLGMGHPATLEVEVLPEATLRFAVSHAAVAEQDGVIYVLGGYSDEADAIEGVTARAHWYDVRTEEQGDLLSLPFPVAEAAAVIHDGYLYVAGGRLPDDADLLEEIGVESASDVTAWWDLPDCESFGGGVVNHVHRLRLEQPTTWEEQPSMTMPRAGHVLVADGPRLIALGGVYDPTDCDLTLAEQECDLTVAEDRSTSIGPCTLRYAESLEAPGATWRRDDAYLLKATRADFAALVFPDQLLALGGFAAGAGANAACGPGCLERVRRFGVHHPADLLADRGDVSVEGWGFEILDTPPVPIHRTSGAVLGGTAFFLSWETEDKPARLVAYDTVDGAWAQADLDGEYTGARLVASDGDLWVAGGQRDGGPSDALLRLEVSLAPDVSGGCGGAVF